MNQIILSLRRGALRCAVAGSIFVGMQAAAASAAPVYGPAAPVAAFNSASTDQLTDLSPDGLTAVLQSDRAGIFRIFSSTRATTSSSWTVPSNVDFAATNAGTNVGHGILSADGLSLWYQQHPAIRVATRASTAVPFSAGTLETALNIATNYERPGKLSLDGLRMYYEVATASDVDLYVATRATTSSPWNTPTTGPFAANVNSASIEAEPFVTPDELQLFFTSNRAGGAGNADIWWSSRSSVSDPFSTPVNLASVNTAATDSSPELFGNTLFFTSTRGGNYDVYTAVAVPEPAGITLVLTAAVVLGCRRVLRKRR